MNRGKDQIRFEPIVKLRGNSYVTLGCEVIAYRPDMNVYTQYLLNYDDSPNGVAK